MSLAAAAASALLLYMIAMTTTLLGTRMMRRVILYYIDRTTAASLRWLCTIRNPNRIKTVPGVEGIRCTMRSQTRVLCNRIIWRKLNAYALRMHPVRVLIEFQPTGPGIKKNKKNHGLHNLRRKRSPGDGGGVEEEVVWGTIYARVLYISCTSNTRI